MLKRGQVWIETVIYTLIGLSFIGVILGIALPKINASKDRIIVGQSVEAMNIFDSKIREVMDSSEGNVRKIDEFGIKKGKIIFDLDNDEITFVVEELSKPYSEIGVTINDGATKILSEQNGKTSNTKIILNYSESADLEFSGGEGLKEFAESSLGYSFSIENKGIVNGKVVIDLKETSGK